MSNVSRYLIEVRTKSVADYDLALWRHSWSLAHHWMNMIKTVLQARCRSQCWRPTEPGAHRRPGGVAALISDRLWGVRMRLLVTGGAGFIGSNYVWSVLGERYAAFVGAEVVVLDLLTYAGTLTNLASVHASPRMQLVTGDIRDVGLVGELMKGTDVVVHFAAESHVDRSVEGAADFVSTNVVGTQVLLQAALETGVDRFVHVSTGRCTGRSSSGRGPRNIR